MMPFTLRLLAAGLCLLPLFLSACNNGGEGQGAQQASSSQNPQPCPTPAPSGEAASSLIRPATDLTYLGAFRLADESSNGTSWNFGGHGLSYYDLGDSEGENDGFPGSLFGISHTYQNYVSEFSIPTPVISENKDLAELNRATTLQPFVDITAGRQTQGLTGTTLGDIQYIAARGNQDEATLHWVLYEYYMPRQEQTSFGWANLELDNLNSLGMWRLEDFNFSATSKYLFEIPESWSSRYTPNLYLAAGRYRSVNGGSWGPALYATGPATELCGTAPADGDQLRAEQLLYYPDIHHTIENHSNADGWTDGAWLTVANKAAVIFAGSKALRTIDNGLLYYGAAGTDGCGYKGYHGEPYIGAILFYDPADLAAVANGELESWQPQPYAVFNVEDVLFNQGCRDGGILGGVAFDRQRSLLYVIEMGVHEGQWGRVPIVHVWQLSDQGQQADTTPPPAVDNIQLLEANADSLTFQWQASQDNVRVTTYLIQRFGEPIATTRQTYYRDDKINPDSSYQYQIIAMDSVSQRSVAASSPEFTSASGEDTRAPIFYQLGESAISSTSAQVHWSSDEPIIASISYGLQYSSDTTTLTNDQLVLDHLFELNELQAGRTYTYTVSGHDQAGNEYSFHGSFQTNRP